MEDSQIIDLYWQRDKNAITETDQKYGDGLSKENIIGAYKELLCDYGVLSINTMQRYDIVTQLGSTLSFTVQSASVSNTENIEIINQDFGFNLAKGITAVELDPSQEHYFLEVRKLVH